MLLLLCAGCIGSKVNPYNRAVEFDEAEYAPYKVDGTASIAGYAYLKDERGDRLPAKNLVVEARPITRYSKEWFDHAVLKDNVMRPADPREKRYLRETTADDRGRFRFTKLPAGRYYLATRITWIGRQDKEVGGWAYVKIRVGAGESLEHVVLSR